MKKIYAAVIITLLLVSCKTRVSNDKKTFIDDLAYKNISHYTIEDLIKMDYNFLGFLPTLKHYNNVTNQFKKGNKNTFRYLDSLDIQKSAKDTLIVKFYTQNFMSTNQNVYKIGKNKNNDSLNIYDGKFDLKPKYNGDQEDTFRISDYDLEIIEKTIHDTPPIQRIVFRKTKH